MTVNSGDDLAFVFPDFIRGVLSQRRTDFEVSSRLFQLGKRILAEPTTDKLAGVLRAITVSVLNSYGAVLVLALNGYSPDALKIERSMYEHAVNLAYLIRYPEFLSRYLDFFWIRKKQAFDHLRAVHPDLAAKIPKNEVTEVEENYAKVRPTFPRRIQSWSGKSFDQMAGEVGLNLSHPSVYRTTSSMLHGDIWGLKVQTPRDGVQSVPTDLWLQSALNASTWLYGTLENYDRFTGARFNADLQQIGKELLSI